MTAHNARETIRILGKARIVSYTLDDARVKKIITHLGITVPKEKGNTLFFVPRRDVAYIIISPRAACRQDPGIRWTALWFDYKQYNASPLSRTLSLATALRLFQSAIERLSGFAGRERIPLRMDLEHAQN